jgi:hypothetical protein
MVNSEVFPTCGRPMIAVFMKFEMVSDGGVAGCQKRATTGGFGKLGCGL